MVPSSSQVAPLALGRDPREASKREGGGGGGRAQRGEGGPKEVVGLCKNRPLEMDLGVGACRLWIWLNLGNAQFTSKMSVSHEKLRNRSRNVHRRMMLDSA